MTNGDGSDATIFGLCSAAVWGSVPDAWISWGDKMVYGMVLALVTGFAYKAGGWAWDGMLKKWKGQK